jgi:hypothetical protein
MRKYSDLRENMRIKVQLVLIMLFNLVAVFPQEKDFHDVMYVTSKEGLRLCIEPALNSRRIHTFAYGEILVIRERSDFTETIDGITACWYKTWAPWPIKEDWGWVFGGYLSDTLPLNVPVIIGHWVSEDDDRLYCYFRVTSHDYSIWYKDTSAGSDGKWELEGNIIKVKVKDHVDPSGTGNKEFVDRMQLTVINRNKIWLDYLNSGRTLIFNRYNHGI